MARYYGEISKDDFFNKIKEVMDNEEYPYEMTPKIWQDLSKINFDCENYTDYKYTEGFAEYPVGYRELKEGFHVFFVNAGGDWEYPICFIIYWGYDNKLRGYIPKNGNIWNKKEKRAYDNDEMTREIESQLNEGKFKSYYKKNCVIILKSNLPHHTRK